MFAAEPQRPCTGYLGGRNWLAREPGALRRGDSDDAPETGKLGAYGRVKRQCSDRDYQHQVVSAAVQKVLTNC